MLCMLGGPSGGLPVTLESLQALATSCWLSTLMNRLRRTKPLSPDCLELLRQKLARGTITISASQMEDCLRLKSGSYVGLTARQRAATSWHLHQFILTGQSMIGY